MICQFMVSIPGEDFIPGNEKIDSQAPGNGVYHGAWIDAVGYTCDINLQSGR